MRARGQKGAAPKRISDRTSVEGSGTAGSEPPLTASVADTSSSLGPDESESLENKKLSV